MPLNLKRKLPITSTGEIVVSAFRGGGEPEYCYCLLNRSDSGVK